MSEALEAALECFAGRRTAQGDPMRHRFAVLPSRQDPRYLLPLGNSRTTLEGFRVYTPYGFGARLRKGLLAQIVKTGWRGWAMHSLHVGEPLGLTALVTNVTGERNPAFAMLLGVPGKYRKLTIQVMRGNGETLGYIKLGLTKPQAIMCGAKLRCSKIWPRCVHTCRACSMRGNGKTNICCSSRPSRASRAPRTYPVCTWSFLRNWRPSAAKTSPAFAWWRKWARAGKK